MANALSSFSNRPILAYIHEVDGQYEFYSHNFHLDEDDNIVYDEVPVGIIPESCEAKLEYDEGKQKTYAVVNGYIFEEYSKASEIIRREEECPVSVEISIRELSYNAKEDCLDIENFYLSGVTILGKTPLGETVKPGMSGANIKLADFSTKNNSLFTDKFENQMVEMQSKLDYLISRFNIDDEKKGGEDFLNHFEELLTKYNKTIDDINFEYKEMSDEDLDAKFAECFGEVEKEDDDVSDVEETGEQETVEKYIRTYELSHDDIRYSLYQLLAPYEKSDNEYYWISDVYDDYFVYENYSGSNIYGQAYSHTEDSVAFEGERYELFKELLTASEKTQLDAMRSNYEEISNKLAQYEAKELEEKKKNILNSDTYGSIKETKEFVALINNHNEYSIEELTKKCDEILLNEVKTGKFSYTEKSDNTQGVSQKKFANPVKTNKASRYGNLFK